MKRVLLIVGFIFCAIVAVQAQYYHYPNKTIDGDYYSDTYDTLIVSGMSPAIMDSTWGIDSVTLNIDYPWEPDLDISLIAPDGTIVHLSDNEGNGADFTNTCFTQDVTNFVTDESAPFTGTMRPENWLGMINNGHAGNGYWRIHILNTTWSGTTGTLKNWGIHFTHHPAPPNFFDTSTLPIVVLSTNDQVVDVWGDDVLGTMGIVDNGTALNHINDPQNGYNGNMNMHVRGASSRSFPTKSYDIKTQDITHADSDASLLGMPADHSWILYAPWDDKALIRDVLTYKLSNDMGNYAVRTRFVQLVMNGDYRGIYVLEEKISRGSNRVNVHKIASTDTNGTALTGGYIWQQDRSDDGSWNSNYSTCDSGAGYNPTYDPVYPKAADIVPEQAAYIAAYVDSFETQVISGDLYDTINGYRRFLDVPTIIDQQLLQEFGRNVDAYRLSTYFHKNRSGKIMGGPIWDFNLAFGNVDYDNAWDYNSFQYDQPCPDPGYNPFYWKKLTTDTNYYEELKCRYSNLRFRALDTVKVQGWIDSITTALAVPASYHYTRWPILGVYTWPNYFVGSTYNEDVSYMKSWITGRVHFMDSMYFTPSCVDTPNTDTVVTSGIVNMSAEQQVKVYPNPTNGVLHISASVQLSRTVIYNMVGQQVYQSTEPDKECTISLRNYGLANGVYNVNVYTNKGAVVRRKIVLTD